jgi:hypothetical protein
MPELKLGLAPGKNGFFDPITNLYLTLDKPVQSLTYVDAKQLEKITHALLATVPALVLYEGTLPQESINTWKSKYNGIFRAPTTKNIVENGKVIGQVPVKDIVNVSLPEDGRVIEGKRAFDRADKLGQEGTGLGTASVEEVKTESVGEVDPGAEVQEKSSKKKPSSKNKPE